MPNSIGAHLLGRRADPEHPRALALYPASQTLAPRSDRTSRYWYESGAWLDQGDTGECVGHAFAHRWADSPNVHQGIDHPWAERLYLDATLVDLWPDNDGDRNAGTSGLAACLVLASRGLISEYRWLANLQDLITAVLDNGPVCVGVPWPTSAFRPYAAYGNAYLRIDRAGEIAGGHEFVLNGVNLHPATGPPFFRMKNSWSRSWPGSWGGTARITLEDMDWLLWDAGHDGDAVLITEAA